MAGIKTPKLGEQLGSLGEYIANQRKAAGVTIRQLAELPALLSDLNP